MPDPSYPVSTLEQPPLLFPDQLRGKKVLLATESLGPVNGVSRTTTSLIQYLRDHDVDVAVVAPEYRGQRSVLKRKDPELRLQGYPLPFNPDLTVAYPFRLDRIYARTFHPDVIYLASPASVGLQLLLQVRQLHITYQPPVLLNFQTDLSAYSEILFRAPWDRYAVWLLQIAQGFLFSHRAVHTIFYPSSGVNKYLENAGAPSQKLYRLGRGVDTVLFNPNHRDETFRRTIAPRNEFILICVARLAPEKGFVFLAEVTRRLKARGLHFQLVIVGGNKNVTVEDQVRKLFHGLDDCVMFTGFQTGATLAKTYASADLFLHCSVTETFGLVVLESMASGVPVVARNEGGPSEIVQNNVTGCLVEPDDMDSFVDSVERFINNSELLSTMSINARKHALDTTWEKINNTVAWQIAAALRDRASKSHSVKPSKAVALLALSLQIGVHITSSVSSVLLGLPEHDVSDLLYSFFSNLHMNMAICVVFIFWLGAVVPMLVHGIIRVYRFG